MRIEELGCRHVENEGDVVIDDTSVTDNHYTLRLVGIDDVVECTTDPCIELIWVLVRHPLSTHHGLPFRMVRGSHLLYGDVLGGVSVPLRNAIFASKFNLEQRCQRHGRLSSAHQRTGVHDIDVLVGEVPGKRFGLIATLGAQIGIGCSRLFLDPEG